MSRWLSLWVPAVGMADAGFCLLPYLTLSLSLTDLSARALSLEKYHCPVLFTVFTNNTHIVAIRTTGNVYAYEVGSQELCGVRLFRCVLWGTLG